jgi:hypothetical protein
LIRHTPLMAGLAVPGVLAVAAYGLDRTLALTFPQLSLRFRQAEGDRALSLSTAWLIAIPLVLGLRTSFLHARSWLQTFDSRRIQAVAERWSSPTLEWVQPPWGEHGWVELAMAHGLKVSPVWFPWRWEGRYAPAPRIEATRGAAPETAAFLWSAEGVDAYLHEARHYAGSRGPGSPSAVRPREGPVTSPSGARTGPEASSPSRRTRGLAGGPGSTASRPSSLKATGCASTRRRGSMSSDSATCRGMCP